MRKQSSPALTTTGKKSKPMPRSGVDYGLYSYQYRTLNRQCPSCGKVFKTPYTFNLHRTKSAIDGSEDDGYQLMNRRCMTTREMIELGIGFHQDPQGRWVSEKND